MNKVWLVFVREYLATVKTKSFAAAVVLMPLLGLVSLAMPLLAKQHQPATTRVCAVVDRTGKLFEELDQRAEQHNEGKREHFALLAIPAAPDEQKQRFALSQRVKSGELFAFVEIEPSVLTDASNATVRYFTATPTHLALPQWLERVIQRAVHRRRLAQAGVDVALVERAQQPVEMVHARLYEHADTREVAELDDKDPLTRAAAPVAIAILMFISVIMGASPLMQSVLEEKMYRIAEILLASVPPFELMLGKLLGASAVSYTLLGIYGLGGWLVTSRFGVELPLGTAEILWVLLFQSIALLLYGSLFLAVGAACSDLKQSQTLMMPVMLLAMSPMMLLPFVLTDPNGSLAAGASFFPFFSPLLMMLRVTLPPGVPPWQPAIAALLSGGLALLCTWGAAKVFRVGMLAQGAAPSPRELWRWIREP